MPSSAIAAPPLLEQSRTSRLRSPVVFLALALGVLWFICCRHLSAEWTYNEQYNYGWFVPFFALYLFWLRWEDRPKPETAAEAPNSKLQAPKRGALIALAIGLPALLLLLPLRLIEVANPDWRPISWLHSLTAVALTLVAIGWIGGKPWLRHFAFPVLFVLVSVPWISPIEAPIVQGLMPTIASIAAEILSLLGIPAEVQGNLIQINGGVVGVNEACSGVRSLQTSLMIALLFGELKRLSVFRRVLLVVAAIGAAFVANCGRALFLVWIAATHGMAEVERWHDTAGYAIVGLVFVATLALTAFFGRKDRTTDPPIDEFAVAKDSPVTLHSSLVTDQSASQQGFLLSTINSQLSTSALRAPSSLLLASLIWLVAVEITVEAWYRAHERNLRPSAQWSVKWPESAPRYHDIHIDERSRGILHYDLGRGATWREISQDGKPAATGGARALYFFRWEPGHNSALLANAHRPDVCLPATGWRQAGDFGVRNYEITNNFSMPFRHFVFVHQTSGAERTAHAFYNIWEDRARADTPGGESRGVSGQPSAWTRSERIDAVIDGRRHLGQQVMEYLLVEPREVGAKEAEEIFAGAVRQLVSPEAAQRPRAAGGG